MTGDERPSWDGWDDGLDGVPIPDGVGEETSFRKDIRHWNRCIREAETEDRVLQVMDMLFTVAVTERDRAAAEIYLNRVAGRPSPAESHDEAEGDTWLDKAMHRVERDQMAHQIRALQQQVDELKKGTPHDG